MSNPYTDESGVFKNKLGITNDAELKATEYALTTNRTEELRTGCAVLSTSGYGLDRLQAIHKHIFQDVYEWAGKARTVPSAKRMDNNIMSRFAEPESIAQNWHNLEKKTGEFVNTKGLSFEQKHKVLAEIFIEANHIHAFPEGNGRSLQIFMNDLAKEQGVELDYTKVDSREWNLASAVSGTHGRLFERVHLIPSPPNTEPIEKIFAQIFIPM